MPADPDGLRRDIVAVCQRLYQRGFIAGTEGNVSVLEGPERLWITPSGHHKGLLQSADLCSLISRDTCCSATAIPQVKRRCTWRCTVVDLIFVLSYTRTRRWRQPSRWLATAWNRLYSPRLSWPWERCQQFRIRCLPRGSLPTTSVRPCAKPRQPCWKIMAVSRLAPRFKQPLTRWKSLSVPLRSSIWRSSSDVFNRCRRRQSLPCRRCDRASRGIFRHPGSVRSVPGWRRMTCAG